MRKSAELIGSKYAILERLVHLMRLLRKLLEEYALSASYERISLHAFINWEQSNCREEEDLTLGANRTHCDLIFNSGIADRDRMEEEERPPRYTCDRDASGVPNREARNMKYGRYPALLDTRRSGLRLRYVQKSRMSRRCCRLRWLDVL